MMNFLDDFYAQMKTDIGVDPNYAVDKDNPELDAALKILRLDIIII